MPKKPELQEKPELPEKMELQKLLKKQGKPENPEMQEKLELPEKPKMSELPKNLELSGLLGITETVENSQNYENCRELSKQPKHLPMKESSMLGTTN